MDLSPVAPVSLRPLGIGELLDRAVTLCVRHFWTFALIYVVFAVPLALFQYFGTQDQAKIFSAIIDAMKHASGKPGSSDAVIKALGSGPVMNGWTAGYMLLLLFVSPLPTAALIAATSAAYLGRVASFADAYRVGLSRWLNLVLINAIYISCALLMYLGLVLIVIVLALGIAALVALLKVVGAVIAVIVGIALGLAFFAFVLVAMLALQVSYFTCVIEGAAFITSFSVGIRRVFRSGMLKRSLLVALAYIAIAMGIGLVTMSGQGVLFGLVHSNVAGTAFGAVVSVATVAFTTAFMAIFYYDLRVRTEGLDLQLQAASPAVAVPVVPAP